MIVIPIPRSRERNLTIGAWITQVPMRAQTSFERSFAPLRMTATNVPACSSIAAALHPVYECLR